MNLSQASELTKLRGQLSDLRKMESKVGGYPPFRGELVIDGQYLELSHSEASLLVSNHLAGICSQIEALGVEVDE